MFHYFTGEEVSLLKKMILSLSYKAGLRVIVTFSSAFVISGIYSQSSKEFESLDFMNIPEDSKKDEIEKRSLPISVWSEWAKVNKQYVLATTKLLESST